MEEQLKVINPKADEENDSRKFLSVLLPEIDQLFWEEHYLEVRIIDSNSMVKREFLPIDSKLCDRLEEIQKQMNDLRYHTYVGVAFRDSKDSGRDENCSRLTALLVDYDEVSGLKIKDIIDTSERDQVKNKLLKCLKEETNFPPTMIVDSGNGYHAYYALSDIVDIRACHESIKNKKRWLIERYAEYPGDPAMLKISQPIRLPGTLNVKKINDIRRCSIVEYNPSRRYTFAELPESEDKKKVVIKKKGIVSIAKVTGDSGYKYPFWDCNFLNWMVENPADQTYHQWMAAASTLAYFGEDGREAFHELSCQYPQYKLEEAERFFDNILKSYEEGIGPITYAKLEEYSINLKDDTDDVSPAIYIKKLWQKDALAKIGITYDEDKKKSHFNANIFAKYILKNRQLLIHEGKMFYEYSSGVWQPIYEHQLLKMVRNTIHEVKPDIYQKFIGSDAIEIMKLEASEVGMMNVNRHLINLTNGMLDLNTFTLVPHDHKYLSAIQIPLEYNPETKCVRFEQFIREIMNDDPELVLVLQEIIGYLLTAETKISLAFLLWGQGANGKSLLIEIITALIGSANVSNLSIQDLDNPFRRSNLIGKTVNISSENEVGSKGFNSQIFKAVVSGDNIVVEKKYENSMSYAPVCKFVFAVNSLPYSHDKSYGFFRRVFIVPFNRRFEGKSADKELKEKLLAELPGILNWALVGLHRLRAQEYEFTKASAITDAIANYREEQNPMLCFMQEMLMVTDGNERVLKAKIIDGYQQWCQRNGLGEMKLSSQIFWKNFKSNCIELNLPYEEQTSNGLRYIKKITMKSHDIDKKMPLLDI